MATISLKEALKRLPGVPEVQKRLDRRTLRSRTQDEDQTSRAKERWRASHPDTGLTWGTVLSGDAFIRKAASHGAFAQGGGVMEIGPGYGRLIQAAAGQGVPYTRWVGIDLSKDTVGAFNQRFARHSAEAVVGDAESIRLDERFDAMLSSLTFKHIFPNFERALANIAGHLTPGGVAVFDLIEGERTFFERDDGVTYVRQYTREEAADLVGRAGLELAALDTVDHDDDPQHRRLLVVGRKAG